MKKNIKQMKVLAIAFLIALGLSACSNKASVENTSPPVSSAAPDDSMINKESEKPLENLVPDSGEVFSLTEEEQALYDEFKENKDMNLFKDVNPISIAKVNIMFGVNGEWESEYAMFYKEDGMETALEEYKQMYEKREKESAPGEVQSYANWYFPFIDEGEFKVDGNNGVIIFHQVPVEGEEDDEVNFHMVKDANGIWWVRENPLYWEAE